MLRSEGKASWGIGGNREWYTPKTGGLMIVMSWVSSRVWGACALD